MRVLPLICNKSFSGLWGKSVNKTSSFNNYDFFTKEYQYYPFLDETAAEVDSVIKANTNYSEKICENAFGCETRLGVESTSVKVKSKLPFTSKEFIRYTKNKIAKAKKVLVESTILKNSLSAIK